MTAGARQRSPVFLSAVEVVMSKYDGLADWLKRQSRSPLTVSSVDLDALVAGLPPSARTDRTWWGNTTNRTRVQAQAWLGAGWRVQVFDLVNEQVTLVRSEPRRMRG